MECLLLIFIYYNSKFNVIFKNGGFEFRYTRTHTEEKPPKIFNIAFTLHFPIKIQIAILSTLESAALDENIRCASKRFILTQRTQNIALVKLKCVSYLGTTHSSALKVYNTWNWTQAVWIPCFFYFYFVLFCFFTNWNITLVSTSTLLNFKHDVTSRLFSKWDKV